MPKRITFLAAALLMATAPAHAYDGKIRAYQQNGTENIIATDSATGFQIRLRQTNGLCTSREASYSKVRKVINADKGKALDWFFACDAGQVVKFCVNNDHQQQACASYEVIGQKGDGQRTHAKPRPESEF